MVLKTDKKTLTTEIKKAAKKGGNFVFAPAGDAKKSAILLLSKKKIPAGERKAAKSTSGAKKVFYGTCIKEDKTFIFNCAIKPPSTLGKTIKASIKQLTNYMPPTVEAVFAPDVVEMNFADDDDLREMAEVRRKSTVVAAKWLESVKPKGFAETVDTMILGHQHFQNEDWQAAIDSYDQMLSSVADARKATSETKVGEPEPTGLKRKKIGKEYKDEDKKVGWRATELSDEEVSDRAVLRFVRQSAAYKSLATPDFTDLVKGKDPGVIDMIDQLKEALAKGDQKKVKEIAEMKAQVKKARQELRDSDVYTTKYYTEKQRKKHGLTIGKGGMLYDANGDLFDDRRGFVLDPDTGNLIVFQGTVEDVGGGKKQSTHHSSPLAGGDVAGAGHIKVKDGRLDSIDDASGHYKPDASFTLQTLKQLEKLGAKLVDDTIVDEDGDEVSANKAKKFKLVKAYEQERKLKLKELLAPWVKAGKPGETPKLPPYDPNIAEIRAKLLEAGVGPSQKSTKIKLQGKMGLTKEQFDESKGDVKAINKILQELTGKKNLLPDDLNPATLSSLKALNLKIGERLKRKLSKEQFEQTGGNEDQIRKKDKLNEEIKTKGRNQALALALKELGVSSLLAGANKLLNIPEERLKKLPKKVLEETILGADTKIAVEELEEVEKRTKMEDEALLKLGIKRTEPGMNKGVSKLSEWDLEDIANGNMDKTRAIYEMRLDPEDYL